MCFRRLFCCCKEQVPGFIEDGCDFIYDFTCSPCIADGKNNEAVKFCIDCGEYLCGSCLGDHNRFAGTKHHQMVDPSKYDSRAISSSLSAASLITNRCDKHHGRIQDMFCKEHNEVCCAACLAFDHGSCKNKSYIPDIASGTNNSQEYKQLETETEMILSQLETTKQKREEDLDTFENEKKAVIENLQQFRRDVLEKFDDLDEITKQVVEKRFLQNATILSKDVENIDKAHKILQRNGDRLQEETNDSQLFVLLKTAEKDINTAKNLLQKITSRKIVPLDFKLNDEIIKTFGDLSVLGSFQEPVPSTIFSVKNKDEKYRCNVTSFCQLEDGCLVLTDAANNSVKKLSSSYTILDICTLSSQPFSVCIFNTKEIAVAMCNEKAILLLALSGKLQMSRSLKINDVCAGLASFEDNLFVGFLNRRQIEVYDQNGHPSKTIDLALGNTRCFPWCIAISPGQNLLFVAINGNGVISVDIDELECKEIDNPALQLATSVYLADDGNLLASCKESNQIIVFYTDGKTDVLLSRTDSISSPQALCYTKQNELVIASENSDALRVYSCIDKLFLETLNI